MKNNSPTLGLGVFYDKNSNQTKIKPFHQH